MGLLLQLIGLVCVIGSLIWNIYNIVKGFSAGIAIALLVVGIILINIGRKLH